MRQRDDSTPPSTYAVEDEVLAKKIDALLNELKSSEHLDLLREVFVTGVKLGQESSSRLDLKILRTSIKEMRYAFKVFSRYRHIPKISIFGSSRCPVESPEFQTAKEFAKKMADSGYMIITGAGGGIMWAGNLGAGKERSFGLNITLPMEQTANETIRDDRKLINFRYFFSRKLFFVKESDAIVLLPGGLGTQDEGFESLTLLQTGKNEPTPIVMLDRPGGTYWKDWYQFVNGHLVRDGYIAPQDLSLFSITDRVDAACEEILTFYRRYHSSRYVNNGQNLVLRLKESVGEDLITKLNETFQDILVQGSIEPCKAFAEEDDEPDLSNLPRLALCFDRHHHGRLRELIDTINQY